MIYALFEKNVYTLSYRDFDGSLMMSEELPYDSFVLEVYQPIRDGYEFEGWYFDMYYTTAVNFEIFKLTGNIQVYAKWYNPTPVLTYYEFNNLDIIKVVRYQNQFFYLSNNGKLFVKDGEAYNYDTYQYEAIFIELPDYNNALKDILIGGVIIVDFNLTGNYMTFKTSKNLWYLVKFEGEDFEIESLSTLLNLAVGEMITSIKNHENFMMFFTSNDRVFLYGTLRVGNRNVISYTEPLDVTASLGLAAGEVVIDDDCDGYCSANESFNIYIKTNKRILVPTALVNYILKVNTFTGIFADINDIDENTYQNVSVVIRSDEANLLLNGAPITRYYSGNGSNAYKQDFHVTLNPDEYITASYYNIVVTSENRVIDIVSNQARALTANVPINGLITNIFVMNMEMNALMVIIKSSTNHYYIIEDPESNQFNMIDITAVVAGYTFDGLWSLNNKAYMYSLKLNQMELLAEYVLTEKQVATAIIGNLNARSIGYSWFDIYYDPGFTNLWDHVSLYLGIELFVDVY